jgi:N-acetylneuraminic acid mutarotase
VQRSAARSARSLTGGRPRYRKDAHVPFQKTLTGHLPTTPLLRHHGVRRRAGLLGGGGEPDAARRIDRQAERGRDEHGTKAKSPTDNGGAHPTARVCPVAAKAGYAECDAVMRTDVTGPAGVHPNTPPAGYGPADLQSAYNLPSATAGGGATVGIVDAFDYPNAEAELGVYRAQYGLPACTTANGCFQRVDQRGGTSYPSQDSGWQTEEALDLQMVSAVCPNCHILLVEADDNSIANLGTAVNEAVTLGAKYVSNSYGGSEDPSELSSDTAYYNHPGVVVTASTGDSGYGPQYPAASADVTAVGGTSLVKDSSTRGWSESAWSGGGSGCSADEPKPAYQTDTGCSKRTEADVSAVADPNTGVAEYVHGGWLIQGGTSVSSPIMAAVYALAGTPVAGTYPNSYPYAATAALNDVTAGTNGTCTPAYLCTAGPGYDGPTGLGTPNGVSAFTTGPTGIVSGTVTAGSSTPLPGALVTAGTRSATTDAQGHYSLTLPVGTYTVTASKFGYTTATQTGVVVASNQTVTENFGIALMPDVTVSGLVLDGSGHGWPVYAQVQVAGQPTTAVYTDPNTGRYAMTVPEAATYTVQVNPIYNGYQADSESLQVGVTDLKHDVSLPVDQTCSAPGYGYQYTGATQTFDTTTTPAGWTVTDGVGNGQTWVFNDPGGRGNHTGGSGDFAMIDSDHYGSGNTQDSSLVSPVLDFTSTTSPTIQFANDYDGFINQTASVDYTTDGGTTWTSVWSHASDSVRGPSTQSISVPALAGKSAVQVRFHFTSHWGFWWELDNVFIGNRVCAPTPGGLVTGHVYDKNTNTGVNGATVTSADHTADTATTYSDADPAQGNGFFWMFSSLTGSHTFTATAGNYTSASQSVNVATDWVTPVSFSLPAGRLSVNTTSISKTVAWQGTATKTVKVTNTGSAPVDVKVNTEPGGFAPAGQGAALQSIKGNYTPGALVGPRAAKNAMVRKAAATPSAAPWQTIADFPTAIMDNGVADVAGKVYSISGFDGSALTAHNYVYDPTAQAWTAIADIGAAREAPEVAAVGTKIYVVGGWGTDGNPVAALQIYDTTSNTWSTGASIPTPYAAAGVAVVNGKVYVVGGCGAASCGNTNVQVYDPVANTWTAGPAAPAATSWESCGGISGVLYCAGGDTDAAASSSGYALNVAAGTWSPIASLPETLWASGHTVANGQLLVSGGVGNGALTNAGWSYDPGSNSWTALPNSNNALYRGGSACGLYKIGGSSGNFSATKNDELLPGYDQCGETVTIPWLSVSPADSTIAPGKSATFTVTLNANIPSITQPGTFTASLQLSAPVPQPVAAIPVSFTVNPPATWGKITGTVTGLGCTSGSTPIPGATVQINTWTASYTLKTDANGQYQLWLDYRNNPLTLIVAKDGWQPQTGTVNVIKKQTVTSNWALKPDSC